MTRNLLPSRLALKMKLLYFEHAVVYSISLKNTNAVDRTGWNDTSEKLKVIYVEVEIAMCIEQCSVPEIISVEICKYKVDTPISVVFLISK